MKKAEDLFKRPVLTNLEIGLRIRAARRARGLTLAQMAGLGPINAIVLGSYERGARNMPLSKLGQIASVLNIEICDLLGGHLPDYRVPSAVIIDLRTLSKESSQESSWINLLRHFCVGITSQRNDWNGEVLSLREGDLHNISLSLGIKSVKLMEWLDREHLIIKARARF